ncbi:MAG TPA: hypothetical protein PK611_09230, partial [Saprospiraceae bacterium]|nr:hypothetical protein [Saprospiraceae bacterium]
KVKLFKMNRFIVLFIAIVVSVVTLGNYSCAKEINIHNSMEGSTKYSKTSSTRSMTSNITNDYKIWKLQNSEISVIFPLYDVGTNYIWIIQALQNNESENFVTISNAALSTYDKKFVKLTNSNNRFYYLLTGSTYQNYQSNSSGIIRLENETLLNALRTMDDNTKNDIIDDVQAKATCKDNPTQLNPKGDESCKCAGGYGATECSCGGSIASVSWSEQVSCGEGKYASCTGLGQRKNMNQPKLK